MALESITLCDDASGTTAKVLPGYGFNCYSFRPVLDGEPVDVLWSEEEFHEGTGRPSHSGIPILFPFAGRLRGSHLSFGGHTYPLGSDDGKGNAIHGFVLGRPWRVIEQASNRVVGEFQGSVDEPGLIRRWPADFRLQVAYQVSDQRLTCEIEVFHPGSGPLPFALGTHPYFRVPLGRGGLANECRVTVPAREYWELENQLPTGRRLPASGARDLEHGMTFGDTQLDDVFTGLSFRDGQCLATIEDDHNRRTLELSFDESFHECVVYNPPHRKAICIEPYSCVPDPYALGAAGVATTLRVLEPGESLIARTQIRLIARLEA